jgi:hypothetical protein
MVLLETMLNESAESNYKWWKDKGAIHINYEGKPLNEPKLKIIEEVGLTLAEVSLIDLENKIKGITK